MKKRPGYLPNIEIMNDRGRGGFLVQVANSRQRFFLSDCKTEQEVTATVEKLRLTWPAAKVVDHRKAGSK